MARWKPAPVIGGAYSDDAKPWTSQDTVNYIPVMAERPGGRSPTMLRGVPGMVTFCNLGTGKPIRGARNVEGALLVVSGTGLYQVATSGAATLIGTIPGVGRVSMSHNQITGGNEVAIANGQSGYVYNTVTGTLAQITDEGFPGAISFDFIDGYITGIEPARRFAFHSNLAAATDYNTLDRYEAEGSPDKLVGQIVDHREWWLFSERTIEPFVNTGAATNTFQRASNTMIEVGCASGASIAQMDSSVFWVGNDDIVYRANGYTPQRISTHAIEQALAKCNLSQCFAFTFEDQGHKVYYITCTDGQTWGYDASTGEWHRRQSEGLTRWRINTLTKWNGYWIAGDYTNGKLYKLDWNVQHEDGAVLERRRITGVLHDNQNRVTVDGVALVFDTGGPGMPRMQLSGDLLDGQFGASGTLQYAATNTVGSVTYTIVSGALPPGATMSADGLVSYSYTTPGNYAWTVSAANTTGDVATLADAASVKLVTSSIWALLGTGNNTTIDFAASPDSWPLSRTLSTPFNAMQSSPAWNGSAMAVLTTTPAQSVAIMASQEVPGATVTASVATLPYAYTRIRGFSGVFIAWGDTTNGPYAYSTNNGATWTTVVGPSSLLLSGIARMASGRWVAFFRLGATQQLYYSDQAIPTTWTLALGSISGTGNYDIATDGTTCVFTNNAGNAYISTDGATWAASGIFFGSASGYATPNMLLSPAKGIFIAAGFSGSPPSIGRSTDGGATWTLIALPSPNSGARLLTMSSHAGVVTAQTAGEEYISTDYGATWTKPARAPLVNAVIAYLGDA